jgi:hypothetical protein
MTATKERTKFVIDGVTVTLIPREWGSGSRAWGAKSRVYGAIEALGADLAGMEPQWVPEPKGVESDPVTKLKGKIWRAWRDGTKAIVAERLSELASKLGTKVGPSVGELSSAKVTFSYKAGCSCGCSPGFILDGRVKDGYAPADIFLSLEKEEK